MGAERRQNERFDISGDYFYYQGSEAEKINCRLNNISATGACIDSDENIKINDVIYLHIRGTKNIEIKSKAVWKIDNQYGLMFLLDSSREFENISYIMNYVV
ncbi:MAG: PilZ domain-containing protein [Spirochaetes bacterium]|nr:PilZ domain-containing protein [Spirochaetota bacterium]